MENQQALVSRRDYTRHQLRYIKKCYHPSGRFEETTESRFDYIFQEFAIDPSLPTKLIPCLEEISLYMNLNFCSRKEQEGRLGLVPVIAKIYGSNRVIVVYDKTLLQNYCDVWNKEN